MKFIDGSQEVCPNDDGYMTNPITCENCQDSFICEPDFKLHRSSCESAIVVKNSFTMVDVSKEEHINEVEEAIKHNQDAVNNNVEEAVDHLGNEEDQEDNSNDTPKDDTSRISKTKNNGTLSIHPGDKSPTDAGDDEEETESNTDLSGSFPQNHVTLEALQNTKVAVAQFAANALAAGAGNGDNEAALKDLAVLHSTLFQLQHQHVFQLQLIQQLQSQLSMSNNRKDDDDKEEEMDDQKSHQSEGFSDKRDEDEDDDFGKLEPEVIISRGLSLDLHTKKIAETETGKSPILSPLNQPNSNQIPSPMKAPMCHISSSLASTIITNHDTPPSLDEPNSLEMLQKRAQEVLDSASQGLLAGNLADELAFRKDKVTYDSKGRAEPFFKHRCRYCGKVFGSDSALQIHIRSHTGERPFKCNVCGSRFTTKGNLKVHFQRHTSKFPHIQMNPNPIPEHLDKYHPPLLAQLSPSAGGGGSGRQSLSPIPQMPHQQLSGPMPQGMPFGQPGPAFPGLNLYRPPLDVFKPLAPHSLFSLAHSVPHMDQELPADLSKPNAVTNNTSTTQGQALEESPRPIKRERSASRSPSMERPKSNRSVSQSPIEQRAAKSEKRDSEEEEEDGIDEEALRAENDRIERRQQELLKHLELENERIRAMDLERQRQIEQLVRDREEKEMDRRSRNRSKVSPQQMRPRSKSNEEAERRREYMDEYSMDSKYSDNRDQDEPENLSAKPRSARSPQNPQALLAAAAAAAGSKRQMHQQQLNKDAALYSSLLNQRPGSNDNSWESLIEVTKTSETSKLQQLVDNIENKLTDPNQCVVCHRVLSCKSALQMHYRTHTGERPFRCRICGRAFTTKGNLKTHMGVHRMKPPMRTLHQCPVCHKRYSNALVLQQHIRTHTGEPTDLTAEQISAAEVRDFPSLSPGAFAAGMNPFGFPIGGGFPSTGVSGSGSSQDDYDEAMDNEGDFDDDNSSVSEQASNSQSEYGLQQQMESQMRTITSMASQLSASGINKALDSNRPGRTTNGERGSTPGSPPISRNQSSPTPSDNSMGALDLTPKSSGPPSITQSSPTMMMAQGMGVGQLHPHPLSMFPNFPMLPHGPIGSSTPMMNSALNSLAQSVLPATPFNPLGISGLRGNTTCNICFKTFACHSALEIHYRSHTKERPFKCTICDRGFSTKNEELLHTSFHFSSRRGNMKQHMLTHKIRDMPQHMFGSPTASASSTDSRADKSGRRSADYQDGDKSNGSTYNNNNSQREKNNNNSMDTAVKAESGLKRPSTDVEESQNSKRPLTTLLHARSATTTLLASPPSSSTSSSSTTTMINSPPTNSGTLSNNSINPLPMLRSPSPPLSAANRSLQSDRSDPRDTAYSPRPESTESFPISSSSAADEHQNNTSPVKSLLSQFPHLTSSPGPFEGGTFNSILHKAQQMSNSHAPELGLLPLQRELERSEQMEKAEKQSREQANQQQQAALKDNVSGMENSKHLCTCCRKNFSSSSALQIHMRTHTGDKPFRCTVCQKAFTTKGNLKVHMGTHMWSNGASRRGRRMSLELPLNRPLPLNPQDTEFLQRRPDLFYPYLPAPFLNGMQTKMSGSTPSALTPQGLSNKYAGLLGFGGFLPGVNGGLQFPGGPHHLLGQSMLNSNNNNNFSPSTSPTLSDKHPSSATPSPSFNGHANEERSPSSSPQPQETSEAQQKHIWDLHYEHAKAAKNKSAEAAATIEGLALLSGTPQRSEGLAA